MDKILYMVVPCYNEEPVLLETTRRLSEKMKSLIERERISEKSKVIYVNDGSKDRTWEMIEEMIQKERKIRERDRHDREKEEQRGGREKTTD